jgi:transcriptional regulator with XRE-family HTH domain
VYDPDDTAWLAARSQALGARIQAARLHANLTQEAVFLTVGMSRSRYQEIEAGRANPTFHTLLRISRAIDVPLTDLVR